MEKTRRSEKDIFLEYELLPIEIMLEEKSST